jgi:hypothetical protein
MANNLYDYLNQFNLGQLVNAGNTALQGASNALNRAGNRHFVEFSRILLITALLMQVQKP